MVSRGEGGSAGVVDGVSGAEVHGCGRVPADAGMAMNIVVLVEEFGAELFGVLQRYKMVGEIGQNNWLSCCFRGSLSIR